jgi:hypothetical protein
MILRVFTAASIGLLASACSSTQESRYITPAATPVAYSSAYTSEQACADYGFPPGTIGYNNCVARERTARASGRVTADYAVVNLTQDAQNACYSYGLQPRTSTTIAASAARSTPAATVRKQPSRPIRPTASISMATGLTPRVIASMPMAIASRRLPRRCRPIRLSRPTRRRRPMLPPMSSPRRPPPASSPSATSLASAMTPRAIASTPAETSSARRPARRKAAASLGMSLLWRALFLRRRWNHSAIGAFSWLHRVGELIC